MVQPIAHSWSYFRHQVQDVISLPQVSKVLELGAGVKPYLTRDQVEEQRLDYTILDIDPSLSHDNHNYFDLILHDLEEEPRHEQYDLIFSHMVL